MSIEIMCYNEYQLSLTLSKTPNSKPLFLLNIKIKQNPRYSNKEYTRSL